VGAGGGRPPPATRWAASNGRPYRDTPSNPHALVFVRLAHDRRFVGAVFPFFVRVLVLFVFIRISGRHCVAHDHEGSPVAQPGAKFLGVWGCCSSGVDPGGLPPTEAALPDA